MIQLVGKCQLGTLGIMYKNIICLHPLGWFYNYFFDLVEDTKISAWILTKHITLCILIFFQMLGHLDITIYHPKKPK